MDGCSPGGAEMARRAHLIGLTPPPSRRPKRGGDVNNSHCPLSSICESRARTFEASVDASSHPTRRHPSSGRCCSRLRHRHQQHHHHHQHHHQHHNHLPWFSSSSSRSQPSFFPLVDDDVAPGHHPSSHRQLASASACPAVVDADTDNDDAAKSCLRAHMHSYVRRPRPTLWYVLAAATFLIAALLGPTLAYGNDSVSTKFLTHLKTMQKSVCDDDLLHIKCPRNTTIKFNTVFYGRNASYSKMCPGRTSAQGVALGGRTGQGPADDTTCIWKGALKLLATACKNQQECKVNPHRAFRQWDPCPHIKKATDVSYQCRPNLFLYKTVCQGEKAILRCQGKQRRLLVFSAFFGATRLGVPECHQQDAIAKECEAVGATDAIITECQGQRSCQLSASQEHFGKILCAKQATVFLRVVYACIPRDVLKKSDNFDEHFTTDDTLISSSSSSTALTSAPDNSLSTPPPGAHPAGHFTTDRPRPPFSEHSEGGSHGFVSGRGSGGADTGYRHGPPLHGPGGVGSPEKDPPGGTSPSIIYNVPKPGSAGDTVRLHEVIDGSSANNGGQLRSSMSSSTVRGGGTAGGDLTDSSSGSPRGSSDGGSSGGPSGLLDLLWRSVGGAPRQQVMVFVGGGALCVCLVVSMACLIGSISRGKRRAKQQRKKLVVLTPDTCEFDTMGESSDSLPMGHIAPPTLTSTLHRASQGSLLGGTLPRQPPPPPHNNPAALHMGAAGMPGSNPGTIRRIPSDTHPRAPQGSFYYS